MKATSFKFLAALSASAAMATTIHAQVLVEQSIGQLDSLYRNYNLISLGNATFSGSQDTHGGMAVAGDLFIGSGTSIAQRPDLYSPSSDPTVYVGGQLSTNGTIHLESGYASTPNLTGSWSYNATNQRLTGGGGVLSSSNAFGAGYTQAGVDPRSNPAPANWNWGTLTNEFVSISDTIAAATATGTISLSGGSLTFNANGITSGVVVFDLDMDLFQGRVYDANGNGSWDFNTEKVDSVVINVPNDVVFAVNVRNGTDGSALFGSSGNGMNFNPGSNMDQLLWNIVPDNDPFTTDSLYLGGGASFWGSVLAPMVDVGNSGNVAPNGQIIAANYTQTSNAELHYVGFDAPVSFSAVPEPRVWGLAGMLLFGLFAWQQHRRSQALARRTE